ncbi:peptide deformylase [Dietzia sp.]|uniref:peptide deformylase n=1 Tax=Dietzia sp. TaxID=1871616 RepID=UPI002FDAF050
MAIRPIRLFPDPVLRTRAEEVGDFGARDLEVLIRDLFDTMDFAQGVGLAAPQVGISSRVLVYDDREGNRAALVDPEYDVLSDESESDYEGCLSVPEIGGDVERPFEIEVRGKNAEGKSVHFVAQGFLARIIQHETDHLDGTMFMQRLDGDARREAMGAIRAAEWFGHGSIVGDLVFDDDAAARTYADEQFKAGGAGR